MHIGHACIMHFKNFVTCLVVNQEEEDWRNVMVDVEEGNVVLEIIILRLV